jgi:hypothetical protein
MKTREALAALLMKQGMPPARGSSEAVDSIARLLLPQGPNAPMAAPFAAGQEMPPSPGMMPLDVNGPGGFVNSPMPVQPDVPSRGEQRAVGNPADPAMMDAEMGALREYQSAPQKGLGPQGARLNKQAQSEAPTLADRDTVAALGLNSGETRATGWAARMLQAESVLAQLEGQGTRRGQHMLSWLPGEMIENSLYDDEYRQYRQAAEAFINSALRADTGAQINNDEADRMMRELLPAPGDDDQTVAQKRASRHAFIMSMLTGASDAAPLLPEIGQPVVPIEGGGGATHRFNPETGQIEAIQ